MTSAMTRHERMDWRLLELALKGIVSFVQSRLQTRSADWAAIRVQLAGRNPARPTLVKRLRNRSKIVS